MIAELTAEQEATLEKARDEWLAVGLSTEPADRAAATKRQRDGFRHAPASRAKRQAVRASGRTIAPRNAACSLVAVPSRTRPAMPCRIAPSRKKL